MIGGLTGTKMIEIHSTANEVLKQLILPYQSIGIRIRVQRAGCNGHTYVMEWCYMKQDGDHVLETPKKIYIDSKSGFFSLVQNYNTRRNNFQKGLNLSIPTKQQNAGVARVSMSHRR